MTTAAAFDTTTERPRRPSMYSVRKDRAAARLSKRRARKPMPLTQDAKKKFMHLCLWPRGDSVTVTPAAAKYMLDLTGGHVVAEMCEVAGIALTAATDNVYLMLCGRSAHFSLVDEMIIQAIRYAREWGRDRR